MVHIHTDTLSGEECAGPILFRWEPILHHLSCPGVCPEPFYVWPHSGERGSENWAISVESCLSSTIRWHWAPWKPKVEGHAINFTPPHALLKLSQSSLQGDNGHVFRNWGSGSLPQITCPVCWEGWGWVDCVAIPITLAWLGNSDPFPQPPQAPAQAPATKRAYSFLFLF